MIRAEAVVRGQILANDVDPRGAVLAEVSPGTRGLWDQICYYWTRTASAACAPSIDDAAGPLAPAATGAGRYNPLYYALVGWPVLIAPGAAGLYCMRILSALIASAVLAIGFAVVARLHPPRAAALGMLIGITPTLTYLNSLANPNGLEISAGVAAFALTMLIALQPSRRFMPGRVALLSLALVLLINTRSISPLWAATIVIIACAFTQRRTVRILLRSAWTYLAVGVAIIASAGAVLWVQLAAPLQVTVPYPGAGDGVIKGIFTMLIRTVEYGNGLVGHMAGTNLPSVLTFAWGVSIVGWLGVAIVFGHGRGRVVAFIALLALIFLPALVQGVTVGEYGYIWQGRYSQVLLVPATFAAGMALSANSAPRAFRTLKIWWLALASFSSSIGLVVAYRLFAVGEDSSWLDAFSRPEWNPPVPIGIGLIGVAIGLSLVALAAPITRVKASHATSAVTLK